MKPVKGEKRRQVGKHLIANSVARLVALLNFINDVMAHFTVLPVNKAKPNVNGPDQMRNWRNKINEKFSKNSKIK